LLVFPPAAQWLANFLVSTSFPALANVGLTFAYGLYTAFAILSFFFVMGFVRETKGRELEAMDNQVGRRARAAVPPPRPAAATERGPAPEVGRQAPTSGTERP
jgi:Sugar (and other) transporter